MYSLEKLIQIPITDNPFNYVDEGGCGCAFGLSYLATKAYETPVECLDLNGEACIWRINLSATPLHQFLLVQEQRLFAAFDREHNWTHVRNNETLNYRDTAASVKYEIIKYLVENGLTDAPADVNVKELLSV